MPNRPAETPLFVDDVLQRAFSGLAPFTTDVERVQLIVKSLESSLQVRGVPQPPHATSHGWCPTCLV
jgi:hypothetical protein